MESHSFYAGASKVDITPPMGTIVGVDFLPHYARFINDPVYVKALVLEDRVTDVLIAIMIVDICIMGTDFMDEVKQKIWHCTGIHPNNILLASNHNHASGDVVGLLGGAVDISYRSKLSGLIINAAAAAKGNLREAKMATGSTNVPEFVQCRRYLMKAGFKAINPINGEIEKVKTNPFGAEKFINSSASPTDPGLGFLAIKGLDDQWVALLANYSLHYVGDWHVDSITGDYFGEFSRQIQAKLHAPEDFVAIMSNGTSGDVNIWDFINPDRFPKGDYSKTKLIGGELAQRVYAQLLNAKWQNNPAISLQFENLELSVRKPSEAELHQASEKFIQYGFGDLEMNEESIERIYAREQLLLNDYPDSVSLFVQAIHIGDLIIGAMPGEFFAQTGLALKRSVTSKSYFSICLANSYGGYIPPADEMERGGYETWRARSSFLENEAEKKIREKLLKLIEMLP